MFTFKFLKGTGLILTGAVVMSAILYLGMAVSSAFGSFNEYILCGIFGAVYSIIVLLPRYEFALKLKVSMKLYLLCTTFVPALLFDLSCTLFHAFTGDISLFDKASELSFYLILISLAFTTAAVIVLAVELLRFFKIFLVKR